MLEDLKELVYKANLDLPKYGLVKFTWGNVSGIDRNNNLLVIKPSGVSYEKMKPEDMVVVDAITGEKVEGDLNPSSDLMTHICLYNSFPNIGGIVHTHSNWATIFAQSGFEIPCFGTTHADDFYGSIPVTRDMTDIEIKGEYEYNTGVVIAERFKNLNPDLISAILVKNHGPFTWGKDPNEAVHYSVVLEEVAMMAYHNLMLNINNNSISQDLLDKHFLRKHGKNAYYGQK